MRCAASEWPIATIPSPPNERSAKGENVMTRHRIDKLDLIGGADCMRTARLSLSLAAMLGLWLAATPADAASRTWVSGNGSDNNPCTRTAPCLGFVTALSKTDAGGE